MHSCNQQRNVEKNSSLQQRSALEKKHVAIISTYIKLNKALQKTKKTDRDVRRSNEISSS